MPIALDPDQTFKYVLESDRGKENPPAFRFRYLTSREWKQLTRLNDALIESADGADAMGKVEDAVRVALVGWENMGDHGYDPDKLEDIINPAEGRELLFAIAETIEPTGEDLGKSQSP